MIKTVNNEERVFRNMSYNFKGNLSTIVFVFRELVFSLRLKIYF